MTQEAGTKEPPLSEQAHLLGEKADTIHQSYDVVRLLQNQQQALWNKHAAQLKQLKTTEPWKAKAKDFMSSADAQTYEKQEEEIRTRTREIYTLLEDALSLLIKNTTAQWDRQVPKKDTDSKVREYFFPLNDTYKIRLGWCFDTPDAFPLDRPEHNVEGYTFEVQGHRKVRKGLMKLTSGKDEFPWVYFDISADAEGKFHPQGSWQMHYDKPKQEQIGGLLLKLGSDLRKRLP